MSDYKLVPVELLKDWHKRINTIAAETAFSVADEMESILCAVPQALAVPDVQREPADKALLDLGTGGMMAICAFRYCCGRRTYVVSEFVEWAIRNWTSINKKARKIIQRELSEEIAQDDEARNVRESEAWFPLGDDCDRKEWVSLMEFIEKQDQETSHDK